MCLKDIRCVVENGDRVSDGRRLLEENGQIVSDGLCVCRGERRLCIGRQ